MYRQYIPALYLTEDTPQIESPFQPQHKPFLHPHDFETPKGQGLSMVRLNDGENHSWLPCPVSSFSNQITAELFKTIRFNKNPNLQEISLVHKTTKPWCQTSPKKNRWFFSSRFLGAKEAELYVSTIFFIFGDLSELQTNKRQTNTHEKNNQ